MANLWHNMLNTNKIKVFIKVVNRRHSIIPLAASLILQCNLTWANESAHQITENHTAYDMFQAGNSPWQLDENYLCGGYYVPPHWEPSSEPPKWVVSADRIEIVSEGNSKLEGQVDIQYGQQWLTAQKVNILTFDRDIKSIHASGGMIYHNPSMKILGDQGSWLADIDELWIENIVYYFYPRHARGSGSSVKIQGKSKVTLEDSEYTTCAPDDTTWILQGKEIYLDEDKGKGLAKHIRLKLHNTTIFYWPYLQFPIDNDRHSGFLYPQVGSTSQSGFEISLPYYWNIAPNYDATLTPRVLTERGVELQNEFRYLTPNSVGLLRFHFLPNDKKYRDFRRDNLQSPPIIAPTHDPRLTALEGGNHRIGFSAQHQSFWQQAWQFNVDFTYVGDDNYFYDLENDLKSASITKLNQEAYLQYLGYHWQHVWRVQSYELLHPLFGPINSEDYRRLPQWAFHADYPNLGAVHTTLDGEIVHFTHKREPISGNHVTQGTRYHVRPAISVPYTRWWGFFTPRVQADLLGYDLSLSESDRILQKPASTKRIIPMFDLDTGLYFDKHYQSGCMQTLEPRLYYLFVPLKDQSLYPNFDTSILDFSYYQMFRDNRFVGRDRIGDAHQVTLALTSRFLNQQSEEILNITFGEILYLKDRRVGLCSANDVACIFKEDPDRERRVSPFILNMRVVPNQFWDISSGIEYNPNHDQVDKAYAGLQYAQNQHKALSLNYYWMRRNPYEEQVYLIEKPLHQADFGLFWPVTKRWDLLGQYRYDIENKRTIELLAGLEYDSCCLALQLVGNRYLRPNDGLSDPDYANGIFIQVLFKGLSNVGSKKADEKLRKAIPGYKPFAQRNDFPNLS